MKKLVRQWTAGILSVLMMLSLIPFASFAAATETVSINKSGTYTLFNSGNTGSATRYSGSQGVDNNPAGNTLTNNNYDIYGQMLSGGALTLRVGCSFAVLSEITEQVRFTIYAYDVDEEDGEVDTVYLVDETTGARNSIGKLKGMDSQWNTTVLSGISNTLFTVGHTYHLENTISDPVHPSYTWWVYIRSVSMDVVCGAVAETEITDHSFTASINSAGTISTSLYLKTNKSTTYNLEYTAVNNGNQRGSLLNKSINATSSGATASNSFSLLSGSDKGTYTVTVILKNPSNNNVVATYSATAGYSYSAVSYDPNGGSNNLPEDTTPYSSGNTVTVRFDNVPSKNGYTFIGWSTDKNATTPEYTATGTKTFTIGGSDVTLYAIYRENVTPVIPEPGDADIWDGSVASGFESGTGTEDDPYIIKTAAQLAYLAQTANAGNSYAGKFFRLANDIVLNTPGMFARDAEGQITGAAEGKTPYQWTPIGTYVYSSDNKPFSGSFNGDGHEIIGIYIKRTTDYQGLFGYCKNATVKNLGVAEGYVKGGSYVGGVVGKNYAYSGTATVENCYNTGTVSGGYHVGGVVGENGANSGTAIATVINCYNSGAVSGGYHVGGVVGRNSGTATVENCYNSGTVSGSGHYVGGVVGINYASSGTATPTIANCYNTGTVSGGGYVGGVVGQNIADSGTATVTNCYNTGTVSGGSYCVGGVVGINYASSGAATVENCYNIGTVSGGSNSEVGGVVGYNYAYSGTATVENCYNTGTVGGRDYVGGVVGQNYTFSGTATVENCYNTGTVSGGSGNNIVGGVVGRNYADSDTATATVENCYNTGTVSGTERVGGVVGQNYTFSGTATVKNCYYLTSTAVVGYNNVTSGSGTSTIDNVAALTDTQMRTKSSFVGFDFDTVWTMDGDPDYPYPELRVFALATEPDIDVWDGSVASGFESGTGTEDDPYIIKTAAQLAYLAQTTNAGNSYEGKFFRLANDIMLNSAEMFARDADGNITGAASGKTPHQWTPIGTYISSSNKPFSGSFNGDDHEIIGIYINSGNDNQGLFGFCRNATVKNLGVAEGYVKGGSYVGVVVGKNYASSGTATMENCYNSGTVSGNSSVGGVAGLNSASSGGVVTMDNCYNSGTVSGSGENVGGVVGRNYANSGTSIATVINCYNNGTVSGGDSSLYVGGVVGLSEAWHDTATATVNACYNSGTVGGTGYVVGGVVGSNSSNFGTATAILENCYNTGAVSGGSSSVGGVVGYNSSCNSGTATATIKNCYNIGVVSGGYNVGGVAGENYASSGTATVENCYNTGAVSGGSSSVGGVVGYNKASQSTAKTTVRNCYYLSGAATVGYNNDTSGSGTINIDNVIALTDAQMRAQSSFVGFDFDTVWTMDGDPDYPYPELRAVSMGGAVTPAPHTHSYAETSRTEPSCTASGSVVYSCACGETYTETVPATGHTEGDWIVDTPATCTESGIRYRECGVCGAKTARQTIPALGHDFADGECTRCHIHQYTVTVDYVYTDGTTARPSVVKTLLEGEKYSINSPAVTNYTADKAVVAGTAIQSLHITVTYREVEARVITAIRRISLGNIDYNTRYSALSLPETVAATTASGETVALRVFWNSADYSPTTFGEQTISGTVIASYGYKFGCEAKTTATLNVTQNVIVRIPAMNLGRLPLGTAFEGLGMPSTAAVVTNSGSTHYLPVVWDTYSYDSSVPGRHTIHGTVTLESGYTLAGGVTNDVEISFELSETMYGTADIVFLIDTTGSMYDEIQNVKNNIKAFADMLEREGVSVRWALVEYRDITCDGVRSTRIIYSGSSKWYIDVNAYKDAISGLTVNGGGDREETVIDALKTATLLENRAGAHSFYVVVTDADYKVDNQYGVANMAEMIDELKTNETVASVVTKTTYYKDYRSLTDGTGGILANIDGNFANELWKLSDLIIEDVVYGPVDHIEIATAPNKTVYVSGDYFDGAGMTVRAVYTSGAEKIVTGYSVSPTAALTVSHTGIEIDYRGKTATQPITVTGAEHPATGVTVSPTSLAMKPGEKKTVTATVMPADATNKNVQWTTDNPNVATVRDGEIEAFEPGTANITVHTADGGYTAVVTVQVAARNVPAEGVYLDTGSIDLFVGASKQVTATVYPADATDKTVVWTSDNESVATVDASGNITALAAGTATVTAATADGGYTAMVLVTATEYDTAAPHYAVESGRGFVGKTVDIYVAIANNPGIISLRNYISYDINALELVGIENTGLLGGYTDPAANITSPYILRWADALATQNNMQNGNIVKLTFKIKEETPEGEYEIAVTPIESRNFVGQKIVFNAASSYIIVLPPVCIGDLDGDGEISDWDAILLQRYLAGWDVDLYLDATDIDGDGEISDWDAILLERYLAAWDVSIG